MRDETVESVVATSFGRRSNLTSAKGLHIREQYVLNANVPKINYCYGDLIMFDLTLIFGARPNLTSPMDSS